MSSYTFKVSQYQKRKKILGFLLIFAKLLGGGELSSFYIISMMLNFWLIHQNPPNIG
ncbi:hypothetical protein AO377_1850 [Moraxella catarrhalis]|nr:hypothetical protein AO377_1850 [Moraxella catarrhalis]OAV14216.1 hypothetical protein AO375_1331 [Moraxella catarrhalis]OAV34276.1 hypothetical protein AO365_1496 [Moraxella catarrhalis]